MKLIHCPSSDQVLKPASLCQGVVQRHAAKSKILMLCKAIGRAAMEGHPPQFRPDFARFMGVGIGGFRVLK
jgi:hypothetical protein